MKNTLIITPELMNKMVKSLKDSSVYKNKLENARKSILQDKSVVLINKNI